MAVDGIWDAVIVGAGPAGIAAAMSVYRQGGKALLLDKKSFPRPKACAGMMSGLATTHSPFSLTPAVCAVSSQLLWKEKGNTHVFSQQNMLSHRIELDHFMLQRALLHGVVFLQATIHKLKTHSDHIQIITKNRSFFTTRTLIVADGANSTIRRLLGLPQPNHAFAVEADIALPCNAHTQPAVFDYDALSNGYAWWFPKINSSNIGIYVNDIALLENNWEAQLKHFQHRYALHAPVIGKMRGAAIGIYGTHTLLSHGAVLFCGDAAGLASPYTGEGISYAFYSGKLAGQAAMQDLAPPNEAYQKNMDSILTALKKYSAPFFAAL